ncbi:MAG: hypothetical protein AAB535_00060 [Patescibacteria group bacterium]
MKKFKYILIVVFAVFAATSVFLTIEAVATGSQISKLNLEEGMLMAKQGELRESIVRGISMSNLEEKSKELGFTSATEIVYINENEGVAAR